MPFKSHKFIAVCTVQLPPLNAVCLTGEEIDGNKGFFSLRSPWQAGGCLVLHSDSYGNSPARLVGSGAKPAAN